MNNRKAIEIVIREIRSHEIPLLTDFLYEAIFQPANKPEIPRTVLQEPMIWAYVDRFGTRPEDFCLVALADGVIVGAAWSRNGCSYGKWMIRHRNWQYLYTLNIEIKASEAACWHRCWKP